MMLMIVNPPAPGSSRAPLAGVGFAIDNDGAVLGSSVILTGEAWTPLTESEVVAVRERKVIS